MKATQKYTKEFFEKCDLSACSDVLLSGGEKVGIFRRRQDELEAVYERNADMLYRIALTYLQSSSDAQDAVHDVFVKYMKNPGRTKDNEHERAWLIRVTVNYCLDMLRRRKHRDYIQLDEIAESVTAESEHISEEATDVMKSLALIPEKNKSAIILHCLEGYSVEETAKILSISVSAVKMRLSRGREALRKILNEEGSDV